MARGRLISKSLGSSRKFHAALQAGGKLGEFCQLLFPLIVANTDDFGRMPGDAFTIKNVVLPSSHRREAEFDQAMTVLHDVGLLTRYTVDGVIFLEVNDFRTHQPGLHQRGESRYPETDGDVRAIPAAAGNVGLSEEKGREGKGREEKTREGAVDGARTADRLFAEFWAVYPKKKAKEAAQKAWDKRRPDADLLSVILSALTRQKASPDWHKDNGRYIPFPATWLNRAQWTDEDPTTDGLSDSARYNLAASDAAEQIILENEARRTGTDGHRR